MQYLNLTTLELFIYFIFKTNSIRLEKFQPKELDKELDDIINNNLQDSFIYRGYISFPKQNKGSSDLNFLIKDAEENKPGLRDFEKIYEILTSIKRDRVNTKISCNELLLLRDKIWSPKLYLFLLLELIDKKKLLNYLKRYIDFYKQDKLLSKENFYNFRININEIISLFKYYLTNYSSFENQRININPFDKVPVRIFQNRYRLYETIYYLEFNNYISIDDCYFLKKDGETKLGITINLKKDPSEININETAWLTYKNLRINIKTGESKSAYGEHTFRTSSRQFRLLKYLLEKYILEKDSERINIYDLYDNLSGSEDIKFENKKKIEEFKKDKIKQYIKELNRRLGPVGIHIRNKDFVVLD